ncbi:MAG: hypothetical protein GF353_28120 [Candidatus Lokiarchaeota archaeon]|nr:hypothetical protein [Candidatus Lokiarchaeota archaeon]
MDGIRIIKHTKFTNDDFNNPICFLGMPGIADVGKFAIDSLIGQLKAQNFMDIIFDEYPAGAIVDDSILTAPKAEILFWKDPDFHRDILLITADAQSLTPKGIYKISNFLTDMIYNYRVSLIVALGAYPVNGHKMEKINSKIYVTSTSRKILEDFLFKNECEKIQKGVIIGANGLIPTLAKARYNIDGLVVLAETDNIAMVNEDITDLRASISLLQMIKESFSLPIKKKYSLENIDNISKNFKEKRDKLEKDLDTIQMIENPDDKRKSLYI